MIIKPSEFGGLFSCQRILVVGANGAGKTWFAVRLADRLGVPVFHNDALALLRNWERRSRQQVDVARAVILDEPRWVLEGGPSILTETALSRADLVVWLDMPKGVRVRRIIWRSLRFMGQTRPEHPKGNADWPGLRQFRFIAKAWRRDVEMRQIVADALSNIPVIHLTSVMAVNALV
jgi:shikimate kinase